MRRSTAFLRASSPLQLLTSFTPELTVGQDGARNTGSSYVRMTGAFILTFPFLITALQIKIRNSFTYAVDFVSAGDGTTSILSVTAAQAMTGGGLNTIVMPRPLLFRPGIYYPSVYKAAATTWTDAGLSLYYAPATSGLIIYPQIWYTGALFDYAIAMKLVGHELQVNRYSNLPEVF